MVKRTALIFMLAITSAITSRAQQPSTAKPAAAMSEAPAQRAEVLVLGTFHMANPGHDIFNMQADDVLAPKRQAEMAQLMEVLKKFRPTKIAVESDAGSDKIPKRYADYLAGKYQLTANEIDQIGLRLAKELGHKTVYAVDADGDFPYPRLLNYAKGSGRAKELDAIMDGFNQKTRAQGEYLATHTILETLLYMNADDKPAYEMGLYYRLGRFGDVGDWAGADLIADWFHRNIRIYSNIMKLVESPNERVLVIYGAGHLGWLQHDFASNPDLKLRKLAGFQEAGGRK
jgi:Family of unknown function (DUF5694)